MFTQKINSAKMIWPASDVATRNNNMFFREGTTELPGVTLSRQSFGLESRWEG